MENHEKLRSSWPVGVSSKDDKVLFRPMPPDMRNSTALFENSQASPSFFIRVAIRQKRVRRSAGIIETQKTGSTLRKTCPSATLCTTNIR